MPYYHKLGLRELLLSEKLYACSNICNLFMISTKLSSRLFLKQARIVKNVNNIDKLEAYQ